MSEEIDRCINKAVHDELKDIVKNLLIEDVDKVIIYKTFTRLTKVEIDEIEVEAAEIRRNNFNREYWRLYYEQHKDDPNNIMVQIHNDAVKEAKREYEAMIIKNMKVDNIPLETLQNIFPQYSIEEMDALVTEVEKNKKINHEIEMMVTYFEKHQDEENAITQYLADLDGKDRRDAQILLIKDMKRETSVFDIAEFFDDFTIDEIEKI
jgi:hypothetical protein